MKVVWSIAAVSLFVIGIAASIWWRQREKDRVAHVHSTELQSQVRVLESELAESREQPHLKVTSPLVAHSVAVSSPTGAVATPPSPRSPNPAMLQDPETRALMRKQQEQALTKLADRIVSKEFAREWNLSPAQIAQVKDLVREKAAAGKDMLNAMLFDGLDDMALAERGRETKQRLSEADTALRNLLGADGFNALTQQERSLEDRDRVKRIRDEWAAGEQPLTQAQRDALLEAMGAERQAFSFRVDFSDPSKFDFEHIRDEFSEANLQTYFEDLTQLNARIIERAALFLSGAQLEQLKASQQNQLEQARLTVKMTTELFNKRRANGR